MSLGSGAVAPADRASEGLDEAGVQQRMQELSKILNTYKGDQRQQLIDAQQGN